MWALICVVMWHDSTWRGWGVFFRTPPPPNWVMHAHALFGLGGTSGEALYSINNHGNFKIKFQTYIFEIILNDNFLRLMYAYTTSDVHLTLSFEFRNLSIKISCNYYLFSALNKQCC